MHRNPHHAASSRFPYLRIDLKLFYNRLPQLLARDRVSLVRQADVV